MCEGNSQNIGITLDMLPPAQREIAEIIGLAAYLSLVERINGDTIYIGKLDSMEGLQKRTQRDEEIISKYNGYNIRQLANEYNLSTKSIYNIIPRSVRQQIRNAPISGQLGFEDL